MPANQQLLAWLESTMSSYTFELVAVLRRTGTSPSFPFTAADPDELVAKLAAAGHFVPLPKEPAALANVMEVELVDYLVAVADKVPGLEVTRGTERGYPDLEFTGPAFGGGYHAVDIKMARRNESGTATQSAITLYTGNTYFKYRTLHWPGTFRPFAEYESHLDVIGIYTLDAAAPERITQLELLVTEPWRVASKQRSSSTREYLGAVKNLDRLRAGNGEFDTEQAFYDYWRKFHFKMGRNVGQQLEKLLRG